MFRKSRFTIDDGLTYQDGWTDGTTWNGWDCPMFERLEADKVMAVVNAENAKYDAERLSMTHDADLDAYKYDGGYTDENGEIEWDVFASIEIDTPEGRKTVYPIGYQAWVWWEREADDDAKSEAVADDGAEAEDNMSAQTQTSTTDQSPTTCTLCQGAGCVPNWADETKSHECSRCEGTGRDWEAWAEAAYSNAVAEREIESRGEFIQFLGSLLAQAYREGLVPPSTFSRLLPQVPFYITQRGIAWMHSRWHTS